MARKPKPTEATGPDLTVPTPRAGKPDASIVTYYAPGRAFVSYTDAAGVAWGEECAADEVRATTVRLARAHGPLAG